MYYKTSSYYLNKRMPLFKTKCMAIIITSIALFLAFLVIAQILFEEFFNDVD
tara:strand:- start:436 stop:591 length:156 start_codon:yes stop_codon:yes gene_type:complete